MDPELLRLRKLGLAPNTLLELLIKYPNEPWDWYHVSCNINITMDDIIAHPELPWNGSGIDVNPNINDQLIDINIMNEESEFSIDPNIMSNFDALRHHTDEVSFNPYLTCEDVTSRIGLDWNWKNLSRNLFESHHIISQQLITKYKPKNETFKLHLIEMTEHFKYKPLNDRKIRFAPSFEIIQ